MGGIDRVTGRPLDGWPHVVQSLQVIFTTSFGSRIMRRHFGSQVPSLLGENIGVPTVMRFVSALVVATELWEPRFKVAKVDFGRNSPEDLRSGKLALTIRGQYRPRGHLGDFTPEPGERTLTVGLGSSSSIEVR
ncbi:MAG TPA: GPW/gp25 family protein [Xanthobacteraceae bacterium]|nr:GPW/gp25 family protein [Xanthobacteraceae bacterium]